MVLHTVRRDRLPSLSGRAHLQGSQGGPDTQPAVLCRCAGAAPVQQRSAGRPTEPWPSPPPPPQRRRPTLRALFPPPLPCSPNNLEGKLVGKGLWLKMGSAYRYPQALFAYFGPPSHVLWCARGRQPRPRPLPCVPPTPPCCPVGTVCDRAARRRAAPAAPTAAVREPACPACLPINKACPYCTTPCSPPTAGTSSTCSPPSWRWPWASRCTGTTRSTTPACPSWTAPASSCAATEPASSSSRCCSPCAWAARTTAGAPAGFVFSMVVTVQHLAVVRLRERLSRVLLDSTPSSHQFKHSPPQVVRAPGGGRGHQLPHQARHAGRLRLPR